MQARLKQTADSQVLPVTGGAGKDQAPRGTSSHVSPSDAHGTDVQAKLLVELFENILQRSDEKRNTGICNPSLAPTVHLNKAQFQHAALKRLKTTDIERFLAEFDLDDRFGEVRHRLRLVTNTTPGPCTRFLPSFTPEDLTAYAISQYIEAHSPMHKPAFKTLRDLICNRDMGLFNALGIRAPDDPKSKATAH